MNRTTTIVVSALVAAGLVIAVVTAIVLGGRDEPAPSAGPSSASSTAPGADQPRTPKDIDDPTDPDVVTTKALTAMFTWEPATDDDASAAIKRAVPWVSEAFAARGRTNLRPDIRWPTWRLSKDVVNARVSQVYGPDPSGPTVTRTATVSQAVLHTDGSTTPESDLRAKVTLSAIAGGRWQVTAVEIEF